MSYARHYDGSPHSDGGGWQTANEYNTEAASPVLFNNFTNNQQWMQHPATTGMAYQGYNSATTQASYSQSGYSPYLPAPTREQYGRVSTDPRAYSYNQNYAYPYSSSGNSQAYYSASPVEDVKYEPSQYSHYGGGSSPESDGPQSPESNNGESAAASTSKASKEKKFPCYRVTSGEVTCDKSFARKADLQRHQSCVHDKDSMERLDCTFRKCTRKGVNGFLRKDHLTEHLRHFHNQKLPKRHRRGVSDAGMQGDEQDEDMMQDYGYSQQ